ncbi:hypothetical protein [Acetobacter sp.]|uniref:hypothetical protein n=1 Tax=Acetobacter sp. TaxID=440 RepID=UPI0039E750D1
MTVLQFPNASHNSQPQPASIDPIINGMLAQGGEREALAQFWLARQQMAVAFSRWVYLNNDYDTITEEWGHTDHLTARIFQFWAEMQEVSR